MLTHKTRLYTIFALIMPELVMMNAFALSPVAIDATLPYHEVSPKDSNVSEQPQDPFFVLVNTEAGTNSFDFVDRTNQQFSDIEKINEGDISYGDFDADGDLDLLAVGLTRNEEYSAKIYRNSGGNLNLYAESLEPIWLPSATWIDYDSDGDLDILLLGAKLNSRNSDLTHFSGLYENRNGNFVNVPTNIEGAWGSSADWGDFDNDGDPDLVMSGFQRPDSGSPDRRVSKVYRNHNNGFFEELSTPINGIEFGEVAWYDIDHDRDLDIILTGSDKSSNPIRRYTEIYRNTQGQFFFDQSFSSNLPGLEGGNLSLGDSDRDGDLDLALMGKRDNGQLTTVIYHLNPGIGFVNVGQLPSGFMDGDIAYGDYNNDGYPDLAISGLAQFSQNANRATELYRNGGGFYQRDDNCINVFAQLERSSLAWGDYDNDDKLDLIVAGRTNGIQNSSNNQSTNLYRNQVFAQNNPPQAPTGLSEFVNGNEVTLNWNRGNDIESGSFGLTYNIRVGTFPGGSNIVSPMSLPNGTRQIVKHGNVQSRPSWILKDLPDGTYYWSVQSIDGAYEGSGFASERSFTISELNNLPDLTGEFLFTSPNPFCSDPYLQVGFYVANIGEKNTSRDVWIRCLLSTDTELDSDDIVLADSLIREIRKGDSVLNVWTIFLPNTIQFGQYYILFDIDFVDDIVEIREDNNLTIGELFVFNPFQITRLDILQEAGCFISGEIRVNTILGFGDIEYSFNNGITWSPLRLDGRISNLEGDRQYRLIVRDQNGCRDELNFYLDSNSEKPRIKSNVVSTPTCTNTKGGSIQVEITNAQLLNGPYDYYLNGTLARSSDNEYSFEDLTSGDYSIHVISADGCTSLRDTVNLQEPRIPNASIFYDSDSRICQSSSRIFMDVAEPGGNWEATGPDGAFNFNGSFVPIGTPGTYEFTYSILNEDECSDFDSVAINLLLQPEIDVSIIDPSCFENGSIVIDIINSAGENHLFTYYVKNLDTIVSTSTSEFFEDVPEGEYEILVDNNGLCLSNIEDAYLYNADSTFDAQIDFPPDDYLTICQGEILPTFVGNSSNGIWDGAISPNGDFNSGMSPGLYQVNYYIEEDNFCSDTANLTIEIVEIPILNLVQNQYELENGEQLQIPLGEFDIWNASLINLRLDGLAANGNGSINQRLNLIDAKEEGRVLYVIIPSNGICEGDSMFVEVVVLPNVEIDVPKAITPNGDGINDALRISGLSRRDFTFMVFNQLGAKVFESQDSNMAWNGGDLPEGVYWYILSIEGEERKGSILLKRI